jgi:peroxin-12
MTLRERCKHVFRVIYPWINAIYYGLILAYHIAYLYDYSKYYTPWLHLQGIELRRLSIQDIRKYYQRQEEAKERYEKVLKQGPFQRIVRYWLAMQLAKGLDWFKILLPMGMFFFKFLEWWYASDYHQRTLVRPIPPPPTPIQPHPDGLPLPKDHRLCPICLKLRTNPAALPTGYAYCYPCIFHYVEEHKQCPITLTQVTLEQIRKLYTSGV